MAGARLGDTLPTVALKVLWVQIKWHLLHRAVARLAVRAMMQNLHRRVAQATTTKNLRQLAERVMTVNQNPRHVGQVAVQATRRKCKASRPV